MFEAGGLRRRKAVEIRPAPYHLVAAKSDTPAFAHAQRQRKKVEALFAELKNQIGLRRLRLRRMKFVREQFFLGKRTLVTVLLSVHEQVMWTLRQRR